MRNQIFGFIMAIIVTGTLAGGLSIAAEIEKVDIPGIRNFSQIEGATGSAGSTVGFGGATQPAASVHGDCQSRQTASTKRVVRRGRDAPR